MVRKPEPQDDDGAVQRTTPTKLSRKLHGIAEGWMKLQLQLRSLAVFLGPEPLRRLHDALWTGAAEVVDLASRVRVGEVEILAYREDVAPAPPLPLFAAGEGDTEAPPAGPRAGRKDGGGPASAAAGPGGEWAPPGPSHDAHPQAWDAVPLLDLDLDPTLVGRLEETDLLTVGDVAAWLRDGHELADIDGLADGEAGVLARELLRFASGAGEAARETLRPEWLVDDAEAPEPERPKGKRRRKAKSPGMGSGYLEEPIDFGGELLPRGEVIRRLQAEGHDRASIDRYLQGADLAATKRAEAGAGPDDADEFDEHPGHTPSLPTVCGTCADVEAKGGWEATVDPSLLNALSLIPPNIVDRNRKSGATDGVIRGQLLATWWGKGSDRGTPVNAPGGGWVRGGQRPAFWLDDPFATDGKGGHKRPAGLARPTLQGPALVARVRKLLGIPNPTQVRTGKAVRRAIRNVDRVEQAALESTPAEGETFTDAAERSGKVRPRKGA